MSEDFKINNSVYDISQVAKNGFKKDDTVKNNKSFNLIFDALDKNKKDETLDAKELAGFFSSLKKSDADSNKDITDKELEQITQELNKRSPEGSEIKVSDVKDFFSHVVGETSDDEKISVQDALKAEDAKEAEQNEEAGSFTYTVQMDESFTGIIKRSLIAQGIEEPTPEQIAEAKEKFKENNPGAVRTAKNGVEFLLVGAQVQLEGKLENKDNSKEQIDAWTDKYINKKESVEKPEEPEQVKENEGAEGSDPELNKKANDAGYRSTYSPDYYYDETNKVHMKYNQRTGEFEKVPNLVYVGKDGSTRYEYPNGDTKRSETYDAKGELLSMNARNDKSQPYVNSEYASKKLGLRTTNAEGIYYDEKEKRHFKWDDKKHCFVALSKDISYVTADGKFYDKDNKEITE